MANENKPNWRESDIKSSPAIVKMLAENRGIKNFDSRAKDAPRALAHIHKEWNTYVSLIDYRKRDYLISLANENIYRFYIYLMIKHIFATLQRYESGTQSAWNKMNRDARFIYEDEYWIFQKVFDPNFFRDLVRSPFMR